MRVSDLMGIVRLTTGQHRAGTSDAAILAMAKAGFPRPDLLAWFEAERFTNIDASEYFPMLIGAFAWNAKPRIADRRLVICGRADNLLSRNVAGFATNGPSHSWVLDDSGSIPEVTDMPQRHQVALIAGVFDRASHLGALRQCLAFDFVHTNRLFLVVGEAADALDASDVARPAGGGYCAFDSTIQRWGGLRWHAIYIIAEPVERVT